MQTLDHRYSTQICEQVLEIKNKPEVEYKKYGAMAHKLPILIHTAGLLQALRFVDTREEIHRLLLQDLAHTLGQSDREALLSAVQGADLRTYMLLTRKTLGALLWYKRFAQSILDVEASDEALTEGDGKS
jgi:CRISPR-associated protein Cmr5